MILYFFSYCTRRRAQIYGNRNCDLHARGCLHLAWFTLWMDIQHLNKNVEIKNTIWDTLDGVAVGQLLCSNLKTQYLEDFFSLSVRVLCESHS